MRSCFSPRRRFSFGLTSVARPRTPLIAYCPIAFLTLTFAQWSNALWGFQIAWFLVVLASGLCVIALLDRPRLTWWAFIAAALAAVVGSYSSLQGLVIWPVGLLLLFLRRRPRWTYVSWIALAAATSALYFYNYPNAGPRTVLGSRWSTPTWPQSSSSSLSEMS